MRSRRSVLQAALSVLCLLLAFAPAASAQTSTFSFLLDLNNDNNPGPPSPCTVMTAQGPFKYDYRADMTLNLAALPAGAQPLTWTPCPGFPAVPVATWAFQLAQGPAGEDVFEASYPLNGFVGTIRLGAMSSSSTTSAEDAMVNPPIVVESAAALEIPTLGQWGMIVLAGVLLFLGLGLLRRKGARAVVLGIGLLALGFGLAWAAHITIDGLTGDWTGGPLATDGPPAAALNVEIVSLWAQAEDPTLYLRLDVDVEANQAPVAGDDTATVAEDAAATTVDVLANDSDPDGDAQTITAVTQPANGTVVITNGGADLTYQPNPDYCNTPPGTTLDTFTYTVSATGGTDTATVSMTVTCVDDAPTAVDDAATVAEDSGANTIDVQANDTDPDGGTNTVSAVQSPSTAGGTVLITNGGADVSYQPPAGYCNNPPGTTLDTFTYTLAPGGSVATVTVTVNCVDDAPTAVDDTATVTEDDPATTINVLANDTDPDGGTNTVSAVQSPSTAGGMVLITNGGADLTYQPAADYCNTPPGTTLDTFTYSLSPGGSTATVTVTVNCVDDAPVAVDDTATVAEDAPATTIDVQANDIDPDGGTNTITAVQNPSTAGGTVLITNAGADLTYQPPADYCNTPPGTTLDTFTYTLTPGGSVATVTVTVTCTDDPPTAVNDAATVTEDDPATTINVQANDTDPDGGTNTITAVQNPSTAGGTVLITNAGADLTYQPAPDYCNTPPGTTLDTFTYTLSPGGSVATVTVTVNCVDDAPIAVNDAATVNEDSGANTINVQANDTDVDGGTNTITAVQNPSAQGGTVLITNAGADLTYQPAPDFCNTPPGTTLDTFTYTLSPGGSVATVTVTVTCIDDNPVAVNDAATVNEDSGANAVPVLANDTDVDGGAISITAVQNPSTQGGTVLITGGGTGLTYEPAPNYCNTPPGTTLDTFTYTLSPGGSVATVTVTVTCIDDNPVAVNDAATVNEDSGANMINVLANDTDVDGGPISITAVQNPSGQGGTVLITNSGADLTYEPAPNYCNNPPGTLLDTFTYTLTPGGSVATVTVTVTCIDDPPAAVNDSATVDEDSGANAIPVLANDTDVDGGPISITAVQNPSASNGTVQITGGGTGLTYEPALNYCNNPPGTTPDTFTYTLSPGGSIATVSVTVNCINDPPVVVNETFQVIGNTELRVDMVAGTTPHASETTIGASSYEGVLDNDGDPEGDTITVTAIGNGCADPTPPFDCTLADGAVVHVDANGEFSYTPGPGNTSGSFTYTVTDQPGFGTPLSADGTVTFNFFERVWYVDNSFGGAGNGTSIAPFDTLAPLQGVDPDDDDDYIFVHFGDGTSAGQDAGLVLENGQHLIGEHAGLSIPVNLNGNGSPTVLHGGTPGSRPFIDNSGAGINAVSATDVIPVEIVGLSLTGNTNAIDWTTTGAFGGTGTFTIRDNVVTGAGQEGVDVNLAGTGAVNLAFHDNNLTATGTALDIQETGTGSLTIIAFDDNMVSGDSGGAGLVVNTAIFDATPGGVLNPVSGGTTVIGASGNPIAGNGLFLGSVTGALDFTDLDIFAGGSGVTITGAGAFTGATGTRVTVSNGVSIIEAGNGPGVNVSNATIDLQLATLVVSASPTTGVSLVNVSDATVAPTSAFFSAGSGSSIANATGTAFNVDGGNGTVSFGGSITNTAGRSVAVQNRTGDAVTFPNTSTINDTGTGILVNANAASAVTDFLGTLTLSTGANAAFAATSGGTLRVMGSANTLSTTTGTALNVTNTTIGSGSGAPETGLRFRSISAGTGASGPANGIVLNNTGALGSLTVTGTGGAGSGGTIQDTSGHGISLTSTLSPSFDRMIIDDTGGSGIKGTDVTNVTITNCAISDSATALGTDESNIAFNTQAAGTENNLDGVVTITGNTLTNAFFHGVDVLNFNGSLTDVTLSGNTMTSATSTANSKGSGIRFQALGSATTVANVTKATITNNVISNFPSGNGIVMNCGNASTSGPGGTCGTPGSGANVISITGNRTVGQASPNQMGSNAIAVAVTGGNGGSRSQANFDVSGNGTVASPLTNFKGSGVACSVFGMSTATCTITNNVMVANNILASRCIASGVDRTIGAGDTPDLTATISNNSISACDGNGIFTGALNSNGTARLRIQSNNVAAPLTGVRQGIRVDSGTPAAAGTNTTVCLNISGNTSAGSIAGAMGIGLRKEGTAPATNALAVNGMVATSSPGVETFIDGLNPAGGGTLLISATSGFTNCSLP